MKDSEEMRKWIFLTVWHRCKNVDWGREVWKCVLKLKLPPPIQLHSFEKQKLCLRHSVLCWGHNSQEGGPNLCLSEKAMAPHSSTLAWKIPWTEEPGRPQSMGLLRVGHDWSDLAAVAAYSQRNLLKTCLSSMQTYKEKPRITLLYSRN